MGPGGPPGPLRCESSKSRSSPRRLEETDLARGQTTLCHEQVVAAHLLGLARPGDLLALHRHSRAPLALSSFGLEAHGGRDRKGEHQPEKHDPTRHNSLLQFTPNAHAQTISPAAVETQR